MEFDYILLDILDWVRRLLWWQRQKKVTTKPYELLKTERGQQGLLKLVKRDTPRAVRTWLFSPYRTGRLSVRQRTFDIHLYLDHLYPLEAVPTDWLQPKLLQSPKPLQVDRRKRSNSRPIVTHRVTILEASHFLSADGTYNSFTIFCDSYDFIGTSQGGYRDLYAVPSLDSVARLLKTRPPAQVDWKFELETSRRLYLGTHWIPYSRDRLIMHQIHQHPAIGKACKIQTDTHPGSHDFDGRTGTIISVWQAERNTLMFTVETIQGRIDGLFLHEIMQPDGEPFRFRGAF